MTETQVIMPKMTADEVIAMVEVNQQGIADIKDMLEKMNQPREKKPRKNAAKISATTGKAETSYVKRCNELAELRILFKELQEKNEKLTAENHKLTTQLADGGMMVDEDLREKVKDLEKEKEDLKEEYEDNLEEKDNEIELLEQQNINKNEEIDQLNFDHNKVVEEKEQLEKKYKECDRIRKETVKKHNKAVRAYRKLKSESESDEGSVVSN
jgi:chromosome segregation ATPase